MPAGRLAGRTALVTGGLTGIGAAIAERFATEGAAVLVTGRRRAEGEAVARRIRDAGGSAAFAPLDVRSEEETERAVATCVERFGGIDAVVASAGVGRHPEQPSTRTVLLDGEREHFTYVLDANLTGTFLTARCAARRMEAGGTIVTIASVAAKKPSGGAYAISKAAAWMLTRALAEELGPKGIRVNAIGPGYVRTQLLDERAAASVDPAAGREAAEAWLGERAAGLPLRRLGTPEDVVSAALFLSCDESSYFTGSILHPDGGFVSGNAGG